MPWSLFLSTVLFAFGSVAGDDDVMDLVDRAVLNPPLKHAITIDKPAAPSQAALIQRAESAPVILHPIGLSQSKVCQPTYLPPAWDRVFGTARLSNGAPRGAAPLQRWWSGSFDGVNLPLAVTGNAVNYYVGLVKAFRTGDFSTTGEIRVERSRFRYSAKVASHRMFALNGTTLHNVRVVTLEIQWNMFCGPLCALRIAKKRVVVFDHRGIRLRTSCDGPVSYSVS